MTNLLWTCRLHFITAKVPRVLGLTRKKSKTVSSQSEGFTIAFPVSDLEYASTVWDPWTRKSIDKLKRVQSKAVRFVFKFYTRKFSVTEAKKKIGWDVHAAKTTNS